MADKRRSLLQEDGRCLVCERRCVIKQGEKGYCGTRVNDGGSLFTLNYGNISSISINPIEKKPFFHFYPGSRALTVGFWSCNFDCPWCQNYDISKVEPRFSDYVTPMHFVKTAKAHSCEGTSLSFNEPTLFLEWGSEVFNIARREELYNTMVTNGYMTERALQLFIDTGLDAVNVDIKGDEKAMRKFCQIDVQKVWRNCKIIRKKNVHLEVTTLVIPTVNDNLDTLAEIAQRIIDELGDRTPWHLTRYFPAYEFSVPATPINLLEDACEMARDKGVKFVYLGNIPDHRFEDTYCPKCGRLLIKRSGLAITDIKITEHCLCPSCSHDLKNFFVI